MVESLEKIEKFKQEFDGREWFTFNNAGMGPLPKRVAKRIESDVKRLTREGPEAAKSWFAMTLDQVRIHLAKLLDGDSEQVAFGPSCASFLSQIAFGLNLKEGDRVVTLDQEYGSNFFPWQEACRQSGATLTIVESKADLAVDLETILDAITDNTHLVALSWVQFQTGTVLDLVKIGNRCRQVGAFFVVDGIQGLGQLPFSFRNLPVDAVVGAVHKWFCGYFGLGFMLIRPDFQKTLRMTQVGAVSFRLPGQAGSRSAQLAEGARRFEPGMIPMPQILALEETLGLWTETGLDQIASEIALESHAFRDRLTAIDPRKIQMVTPMKQAGGITSVRFFDPREEGQFLRRCEESKIAVIKRGQFVRFSMHAYHRAKEFDKLDEILNRI